MPYLLLRRLEKRPHRVAAIALLLEYDRHRRFRPWTGHWVLVRDQVLQRVRLLRRLRCRLRRRLCRSCPLDLRWTLWQTLSHR